MKSTKSFEDGSRLKDLHFYTGFLAVLRCLLLPPTQWRTRRQRFWSVRRTLNVRRAASGGGGVANEGRREGIFDRGSCDGGVGRGFGFFGHRREVGEEEFGGFGVVESKKCRYYYEKCS
jgi:hypothetical protein